MIRTVWLAAMCLVALGAVSLGKVATRPPPPATAPTMVQAATVDAALSEPPQQPLIKADRLEISLVRQDSFNQPVSQPLNQLVTQPVSQPPAPPVDPIVRELETVAPPAETKIVGRHWHEPKAFRTETIRTDATRAATARRTPRKEKPARDPRDSLAADRSRPAGQSRHCDQTTAFGGLLRSLNLAPHCGA